MKVEIKKTVTIECQIDSSEAIMFCKGGRHHANINLDDLKDCNVNTAKITFQLDKSDKGRFDHIQNEAFKYKMRTNTEFTTIPKVGNTCVSDSPRFSKFTNCNCGNSMCDCKYDKDEDED